MGESPRTVAIKRTGQKDSDRKERVGFLNGSGIPREGKKGSVEE